MAKCGRKPVATPIKIARGTRKDRVPNDTAPAPAGMPLVPSGLSAQERVEWDAMIVILENRGLLSPAYGPALELCARVAARLRLAEEMVRREGMVIDGARRGFIVNPYLSIMREAERRLQSLLIEFGLTPSSSGRVSVSAAAPKDALEEFLKA